MVFCDISKTFDRVWHQGILLKLRAAGVTRKLLSWFRSYLSNRRQKVVLAGASSIGISYLLVCHKGQS